jgi:hypothetical protein
MLLSITSFGIPISLSIFSFTLPHSYILLRIFSFGIPSKYISVSIFSSNVSASYQVLFPLAYLISSVRVDREFWPFSSESLCAHHRKGVPGRHWEAPPPVSQADQRLKDRLGSPVLWCSTGGEGKGLTSAIPGSGGSRDRAWEFRSWRCPSSLRSC